MNWDAIGAIGEVLGALVVIATLFYLSGQLRQNSVALKRNNEFALNVSMYQSQHFAHEVLSQLSTDPQLASIYTKCLAGDALDPVEQTRYQWFVNSYLLYIEQLWDQQKLDLGWNAHDADQVFRINGPFIVTLLSHSTAVEWWTGTAVHLYLPEFREKIDALLEEGQCVPIGSK
ncbi:MAG: hypothetical protein ACI9UU_001223 [Candidatus Azotimanducaceae bacterium]|jgi:hypothetical protein